MGAKDIFKNLIGIDDFDDDNYEFTQEEIDAERARMQKSSYNPEEPINTGISSKAFTEVVPPMVYSQSNAADDKISINQSGQFKMVVIEPRNYDECRKLVDQMRARKPIIVNLERVETELARKMFDFLTGATYALSGNVQRVTPNIFIFAPTNVNINAKIDRDTEAGGTESTSPWK